MTIAEAINKIDSIKPNNYSLPEKISWLSNLDGKIKIDIIDTHEGHEKVSFSGYNEDVNMETVLLVPAPFDNIYLRWLEAQIDYANSEYTKYNNSITMYNTEYDEFAKYYTRNNMPLSAGKRFTF